ncbi:hypothetical protein NFI96_026085 [Prochilodus magdalenae]|nr:hypothetical protein NFI96_026085 [Prochilodus magdalenae]
MLDNREQDRARDAVYVCVSRDAELGALIGRRLLVLLLHDVILPGMCVRDGGSRSIRSAPCRQLHEPEQDYRPETSPERAAGAAQRKN